MQGRAFKSILIIVFAAMVSACASDKIPFTRQLIQEYRLSQDEMRQLQYFISEEAVLRRELDSGNLRSIDEDGVLQTEAETFIDNLIVEEETPGILEGPIKEKELFVSFEEGSAFPFSARREGKFRLKFRGLRGREQHFLYDGRQYTLVNRGADIHLLISKESLDEIIEEEKVLPGRFINE